MANVTGQSSLSFLFTEVLTSGLISQQTLPAAVTLAHTYANGTGAAQIDVIYAKQLVLTASSPQTIDLTSIPDLSGATVSFGRIREFMIQVVTATFGFNVTLSGGATNPWTGLLTSGSAMTLYAGVTHYLVSDPTSVGSSIGAVVTSGSKTIKLDPGANNVTVNIIAVGCSVA